VTIGLVLVNLIAPGNLITESTRTELMASFGTEADQRMVQAEETKTKGPLNPLVEIVPDNIFAAASSNGNMLQVIFFVILFGIGLILIPKDKATPVMQFFEGVNEVVLKIIDLIMLAAPYGVFALLSALVVESPSVEVFQ